MKRKLTVQRLNILQKIACSKLCRCITIFAWIGFAYVLMLSYIPDEIYLSGSEQMQSDEEKTEFASHLPVTVEEEVLVQPVFGSQQMQGLTERITCMECRLFDFIPVKQVEVHYTNREQVVAAGTNIGIYLKNSGVLVVENGSFTDDKGALVSPNAYRIKSGDIIRAIDGQPVNCKEELIQAINNSENNKITLQVLRGGQNIELAVTPELAADGKKKLGIWVRDDIAGIGTLTYITSEQGYGALGHGVSDIDSGKLIQIDTGEIYETTITGIEKGRRGAPGEVTGMIQFRPAAYIGTVGENTDIGIFGRIDKLPRDLEDESPIDIGYKQEIQKGPAEIICSVGGERMHYAIEIENIDYHPRETNKGIRYRVTDPVLLEQTGGIVQGMSGSPIIQNDRIIGAVTHVFVDDPTKGYGIFIEEMLQEK